MSFPLQELQYVSFPGGTPEAAWKGLHEEAYGCWKSVWTRTLLELDGNPTVHSDDFTRQSRIGCLFLDSRCVALAFFRAIDFENATSRDDSYFKAWDDDAIKQLICDGKRVVVGSNLTVDPDFRGGEGFRLKDLMLGMVVRQMLDWDVDVMTGTMRRNRGMEKSAFRLGASAVGTSVLHGVEVDLVAFYRRKLLESRLITSMLPIEALWRSRFELNEALKGKKVA